MTGERQAAGTLAVPAALLFLLGLGATGAHAERATPTKRAAAPPVVAQVISVQGQTFSTARPAAVTGRKKKGQPTPTAQPALLQAGGELVEGARIQVPEDGYLRLQLADGTVLRVLASSDVELRRLRRRVPSGPIDTVLDVRRGKVEAEVAPKQPGRVFEIHAPGAVASVRGTRFDVSIEPDGRVATGVTEGAVGLRSRPPNRRIAARSTKVAAGQGVVVGADGRLGKAQTLPPAPELGALPSDYEDADLLVIDLGAVEPRAAGYEVRVALDADLRQVVRNGIFVNPRVQFAALSDGPYTLGVRARDASGLAGPEARRAIRVNAHPVPPLYQSPPPGGRITSEAGQLMCSQTTGAEWVHLQVSSRADFSAPEIDQPRLTQCRLGVTALPPGDYQWRVASVGTGAGGVVAHGPFAAPQRFSVVTSPTIAGLAVLDQGESPTLSWEGASGVTFRGQLARDEAFTEVLADVELSQPAWTLSGLARGTYYVRLQARDASGLSGAFSPPRRVRIGGVVQTGNGSSLTSSDNEPVGRP